MFRLFALICMLFFPPSVGLYAKQTSTTVNFSVKFGEHTCNIASSGGNNLNFGDVNISTLTTTNGPEIESELILSCRLDATTPELSGSNALSALKTANLRFTSPVGTPGSGGDFLDGGHNVAILPFFNNTRMQLNTDYNLKSFSASKYKMRFQLVKKSSSGTVSTGTVSVVLNAELTYT
ncbi:fimbrial protein [Salmonella enterica]|nr:fimbrial protein [Salmonella enterica]ELU8863687.1 fimbrial protein [Salmonella enterica]